MPQSFATQTTEVNSLLLYRNRVLINYPAVLLVINLTLQPSAGHLLLVFNFLNDFGHVQSVAQVNVVASNKNANQLPSQRSTESVLSCKLNCDTSQAGACKVPAHIYGDVYSVLQILVASFRSLNLTKRRQAAINPNLKNGPESRGHRESNPEPGAVGGDWAAGGLDHVLLTYLPFTTSSKRVISSYPKCCGLAAQVLSQKGAEPENVGKNIPHLDENIPDMGWGGALKKKIYPV
ncbi:hypothetical protein BYT27DRAFT_7206636 [Phlegmacium glaucopus]|nr:hypothetical protein BYT27DRAFT_7206636 [Phlegmacium glaucopus]